MTKLRAGILKQYLGAILRLFKYQKSNIVAKHMAVVGFEEGTVRKICNYVNFFSPFERNLTKLKKKKKRKPQTLTLLLHLDVAVPGLGLAPGRDIQASLWKALEEKRLVRLGLKVFPLPFIARVVCVHARVCFKLDSHLELG